MTHGKFQTRICWAACFYFLLVMLAMSLSHAATPVEIPKLTEAQKISILFLQREYQAAVITAKTSEEQLESTIKTAREKAARERDENLQKIAASLNELVAKIAKEVGCEKCSINDKLEFVRLPEVKK